MKHHTNLRLFNYLSNKLGWYVASILLLVCPFDLFAQVRITGQVVNSSNEPIPLATVFLNGSPFFATTDDSGVFFMTLPKTISKGDPIVLRTEKIGYNTSTKSTVASFLNIPIKLSQKPALNKSKGTKPTVSANSTVESSPNNVEVQNQPTTVTSYNQSGGITAAQVNFGPPPRELNAEMSQQLIDNLPNKNEQIRIKSILEPDAYELAQQIRNFLLSKKYTNVPETVQAIFRPPIRGQQFSRDSTGVVIKIGSN